MKTEHFDDEIRRKIERLNFPPSDDDIERVHSYVKIHNSPTFWGRFGKTLTYSAAAAVLTSSIIYNVIQHNENKSLLKNTEKHTTAAATPPEKITVIEHRVDTVYVTRYVPVPVHNEAKESYTKVQENAAEEAETKDETIAIKNTESIKKNELLGNENPAKESAIIENTGAKNNKLPKKETIINSSNKAIIAKNKEKASNFKQNEPAYSTQSNTLSDFTKRSLEENLVDSKTATQSNKTELISTPSEEENRLIFTKDELKNKPESINTGSGFGDRFSMISVARQNYKSLNKSKKNGFLSSIQLPSFAINGVQYRTGLAGEFTHDQIGGGIIEEALIGKHLGVSVGLKIISNFEEKYFTDEHFQQNNHQDFRQTYAPKVPSDKEILDISLIKRILTVPIQFTYYQNLGQKFWLFGGIGTDLDVGVSQNVHYDFLETKNNLVEGNVQDKLNFTAFNNLHYTLGAELRLKHFGFQLSPVFVSHFRDVPYSKEKQYLAGQFKVLYKF